MFQDIEEEGIRVIFGSVVKYCEEYNGIVLIDNKDDVNILVFASYEYQKNDKTEHMIDIIGKISLKQIQKNAFTINQTLGSLKEELTKILSSITPLAGCDYTKLAIDEILAQRIKMLFEK